jgi:hypothetical protein
MSTGGFKSEQGGIVFPIMLNEMIYGKVGFAWGVRATGFLCLVFLAIANILMRGPTREQLKDVQSAHTSLKGVVTDLPYLLVSFGYVDWLPPQSSLKVTAFSSGIWASISHVISSYL